MTRIATEALNSRPAPHVLCVLTALLLHLPTVKADEVLPDAAELKSIRESLFNSWSSVSTLSFTIIESTVEKNEKTGKPTSKRYEFGLTDDGRYFIKYSANGKVLHDERQDGKKKYVVTYFDNGKSQVSAVTVSGQKDTSAHYKGIMPAAMWLLMPAGKPLYTHLEGASIVPASDSDKPTDSKLVRVDSRVGNHTLKLDLDPKSGWAAKRVEVAGNYLVLEAGQLTPVLGLWFPQRGRFTLKEGKEEWDFNVEAIKVNEDIPASRFLPPPVTPGVIVIDQIRYKNHIQGGPGARRKLVASAKNVAEVGTAKHQEPPKRGGQDVLVTNEQGLPIRSLLILLSVGIVGVGLYLKWRKT